jgi:phage terminase large subunit-like protein
LRDDRWRGADFWLDAADESLASLDAIIERSEVVTVGIDGGGLDDLFGIAVIGRCKRTREWLLWNRAWAHPEVMELRKDIAQTLLDFERDGDLVVCSDATQEIQEAADIVGRLRDEGLLAIENAVGLDSAGVAAIIDALADRGITEKMTRDIGQDWRLAPAIWGLERKLKNGTFWHGGRPLMSWCVSNAKVMVRGGAVAITKQTSGRAKIDPLIATFNAAMLMSRNPHSVDHAAVADFIAHPLMVG